MNNHKKINFTNQRNKCSKFFFHIQILFFYRELEKVQSCAKSRYMKRQGNEENEEKVCANQKEREKVWGRE